MLSWYTIRIVESATAKIRVSETFIIRSISSFISGLLIFVSIIYTVRDIFCGVPA